MQITKEKLDEILTNGFGEVIDEDVAKFMMWVSKHINGNNLMELAERMKVKVRYEKELSGTNVNGLYMKYYRSKYIAINDGLPNDRKTQILIELLAAAYYNKDLNIIFSFRKQNKSLKKESVVV